MALPGFAGPRRQTIQDLEPGTTEEVSSRCPNESIYILNCKDCTVNINNRTAKISAENCTNVTIRVKLSPLTSFCEILNSDTVHLHLEEGVSISTMMVDQADNITIHVVNSQEQLEKVWWHKVSNVQVECGGVYHLLDKVEGHNKIQIFQHVCKPLPDGTFSKEPVLRENGYPTTEAEKVAHDAIQREYERKMAEMLLKEIKLEKKK